jgi:hypothetical protein
MNPFMEWLRNLFSSQREYPPIAPPNENPKFSFENNPTVDFRKPGSFGMFEEDWRNRFNSPLADSLKQISIGKYRPQLKISHDDSETAMAYVNDLNKPTEMVFMTNPENYSLRKRPFEEYLQAPASRMGRPRKTFIHEFGHVANSIGAPWDVTDPSRSEVFDMLKSNHSSDPLLASNRQYIAELDRLNPSEKKAYLSIDPYYTSKTEEAFAQAFVNAFEFLAETARNPEMNYRKFAGDLEANTPGTGMIIRDMLELPLYRDHPLYGKAFTKEKKKK